MARRTPGRILANMLFTEIVGATEVAGEMGDRQWRELLARHHRLVRRELKRSGGHEVETAGASLMNGGPYRRPCSVTPSPAGEDRVGSRPGPYRG